jgi:hypothetical protein
MVVVRVARKNPEFAFSLFINLIGFEDGRNKMANGLKTFLKLFSNGCLLRVPCCETPPRNRTFFTSPYAPRASHSDVFIRNCRAVRNRLQLVEQKDGVRVNSCGSIAIFKIPTYEKQIKAHYWRMHCGSGPFRAAHRANNAEEIGLFFALSKCKRVSGSFARQTKPASHSLSRDGFRDG